MNILESSRCYNYVRSLFNSICEYYNYSLVKSTDLNAIKEIKKCDITKIYYDNLDEISSIILHEITATGLSEMISLVYRFLEDLGIDINVRLYLNNKDLCEYLTYLDIDYELCSNKDTIFEIVYEDKVLVTSYEKKIDDIIYYGWKSNIKDIIKFLKINELANTVDVYVIGENKEERLNASNLVQNLRWSEIKCEYDILNNRKCKQEEIAKKLKARLLVIIDSEELKRGIITVKDSYTDEEVKIDEAEILDYIISNL